MNVFSLTCEELAEEMGRRYGKGLYHAAAIYRQVFKRGNATSFADAPELAQSGGLAARIERDLTHSPFRISRMHKEDGVVKFVSVLERGHFVESVVIPVEGRTTLCVSSQVGCRMGCRFCTTGAMGFVRNLSAGEIVRQVHAARFDLGHPIDNIVFMGMGEPLDNFDSVIRAVRVMNDQRGLDIPLSRITISTAGHVDGIERLASLNMKRLRLAVSVNSANDGLRSELMPINLRYPLDRLKEALSTFPLGRDGIIFAEYVLLAGVNDSVRDAQKLLDYLDGLPVRINVIAYNGGEPYRAPSSERVERFRSYLAERKVFVCVRRSRGRSIMAACGQLGISREK